MTIYINHGLTSNNPFYYEKIESDPFEWLINYTEQEVIFDNEEEKRKAKLNHAKYFISGELEVDDNGNTRKKNDDNLKSRNLLAIDYDFESEVSHEQFIDTITSKLTDFNYYIYPTISASKEAVRYRLILPISRAVDHEEYVSILKELKNRLNLDYDAKTESWSQWQGLPIKTPLNENLGRYKQVDKKAIIIPNDYKKRIHEIKDKKEKQSNNNVAHTNKSMSRSEAKDYLKLQLSSYLKEYHSNDYSERLKAYHCLTPEHPDHTPSMKYHEKDEPHLFCYGCEANLDIFTLIGIDFNLHTFKEQLDKGIELFNLKVDDYSIDLKIEAFDEQRIDSLNDPHNIEIKENTTLNDIELKDRYNLTKDQEKQLHLNTKATNHLEAFKESMKKSSNYKPISTGFDLLDKMLDGGIYNQLISLGAISSLGKTTLMLQIADNIAKQGKDVLLFSIEMTRYEVMAKSLSRITYELSKKDGKITEDVIDGKQFYNARTVKQITNLNRYDGYTDLYGKTHKPYTDYQKELIERAFKEYEKIGKHIFIQQGLTIKADTIEEAINKHIEATGNKPVVIIDYLQIVAPYNEHFSDKMNTDYVVKLLKQIVMKLNLPIIAISSFNRQNYHNSVSMEAFKESGAIEYTSDVVLGLQFSRQREISRQNATKKNNEPRVTVNHDEEKKRTPRYVEMKVLKNRTGETGGSLDFYYNQYFNYFENTTKDLSKKYVNFDPVSKEKSIHTNIY